MCEEVAGDVFRCGHYNLGHNLAWRWATKGEGVPDDQLARAGNLCDGEQPITINLADAATEIFYRLYPLLTGNRQAAAWFWLREVGTTEAELKSNPHFFVGFVEGCADAIGERRYFATDDGLIRMIRYDSDFD